MLHRPVKRKGIAFRKRRFKRTSLRKLSVRDLSVLDFLWTWKVASTPMLGEVAFQGKSEWWIYKALRQLQNEKYIQLLPRGTNLEQELWALTEIGFEVVLMDRDDILYNRYKPHAPAHDYLATCLQLGDFWKTQVAKNYFTEQMLSSLAPSNFPKGIRNVEGHVPDGITQFQGGLNRLFVGYEVDLNLKDNERYEATFKYYQPLSDLYFIVWLVRTEWMANRICEMYKASTDFANQYKLDSKFRFVLLDDFKSNIWGAKVSHGEYKGVSLRKLHENVVQTLGKETPKIAQRNLKNIFFPKYKSPQKTNACLVSSGP